MILLQRPYMTQYIIGVVTNLLQIETAHLEPTAIETGQQSEQGLVGLPKIKENIVAIARCKSCRLSLCWRSMQVLH